MANEWWRYDPETYRKGFGIIFHRAEGAWIVYETLLRSPAQLSGVKSGDILHSIAGQQFPTTARPTVLASTLDLLDSEKEHAIGLRRSQQIITHHLKPRVLRELFEQHSSLGGRDL